jgi:hypothetical protein
MTAIDGERRHELCRFGRLTEAYAVETYGRETPTTMPLCTWEPEGAIPPAMKRAWGGAVEYERDCAVCRVFSGVEAEQNLQTAAPSWRKR